MNDSLDVLVYGIAEYFYSFRIVPYFDLRGRQSKGYNP